jgi:hypothetical protein
MNQKRAGTGLPHNMAVIGWMITAGEVASVPAFIGRIVFVTLYFS